MWLLIRRGMEEYALTRDWPDVAATSQERSDIALDRYRFDSFDVGADKLALHAGAKD